MRTTVIALAFIFSISSIAAAQEWADYVTVKDGFKVMFPGQPKVTDTTWTSQQNFILPSRDVHVVSVTFG